MKSLLIGLLTLGSLSIYAQDTGVGSSSEQFKANLSKKFEGLKRDMEIQISERNLDFSDYHLASQDLLSRIEISQERFLSKLENIENFLTIYDKVRTSQTNTAMRNLLQKKKEELPQYEKEYLSLASDLIGLDRHLDFPVGDFTKIEWSQRKNYKINYRSSIYVTGTIPNILGEKAIYLDGWDVIVYRKSYGIVKQDLRVSLENRKITNEHSKRSTIFSKCKTQGCIYYLAEDIKLWLKKSQKELSSLEIPVPGINNFQGPKFSKRRIKVESVLDEMADTEATGRPTSL